MIIKVLSLLAFTPDFTYYRILCVEINNSYRNVKEKVKTWH